MTRDDLLSALLGAEDNSDVGIASELLFDLFDEDTATRVLMGLPHPVWTMQTPTAERLLAAMRRERVRL